MMTAHQLENKIQAQKDLQHRIQREEFLDVSSQIKMRKEDAMMAALFNNKVLSFRNPKQSLTQRISERQNRGSNNSTKCTLNQERLIADLHENKLLRQLVANLKNS